VAGSSLNRVVGARDAVARGIASLGYESRDDLGASSRLAVTTYAGLTRDHFTDRLASVVGSPTELRDRTLSFGARLEAEKAPLSWARFLTLAEGRRETWTPENLVQGSAEELPGARDVGTLGGEARLVAGPTRVLVVPSLRLEAARDQVTGRSDYSLASAGRPVVSRRSLIWHLGLARPLGESIEMRANAGHYVRLPSFLELYGYDGRVIGDPTLAPEKGLNVDLGFRFKKGGADTAWETTGSLTAFATQATDLIDWIGNASGQIRPRNLSRARMVGVEAEGRFGWRGLRLAAQATWLDARDEGPVAAAHGKLLPRRPQARTNLRAAWRQDAAAGRLLFELSSDLDYTAGAFATPSNDVALPSRALVGAGLRVLHPATGLRLMATGANLTDWRGADFPGFPLPGRSFFLALGWSSARGWD
jgi:hypothetical protein